MPVRNLDKIFRPQRIAVIGASSNPASVGYTMLANLIGSKFAGTIYPVNRKYESVQGIHAYASLDDLPHCPDLAIICTPAEGVADRVRECGRAGIRGLIIISAGFREIGPQGRILEEEVRAAAAEFDGLRMIGPNCLGIIVPSLNLNASFAAATPRPGKVAFISQSGALCTSVLDWAIDEGIGFSHFVSIGNMLDVSFGDLIDYFASDRDTQSIILYVESIKQPRDFMSAARAFARTRPIVVYKAGRHTEAAQAAASHTGALAGVDAVYEAAFQRAGAVRVGRIDTMFDCAELLARHRAPHGARLAIVTNAGGPGVIATDSLIERRGQLAQLSPESIERLNARLPDYWSHGNPIDILGDAPPERYSLAIQVALADPGVDAVLVILTPQAMTDPLGSAREVAQATRGARKPVLATWMGGHSVAAGVEMLNSADIPTYNTPEAAIEAFMDLVHYARNVEVLYETPRDIPLGLELDRQRSRQEFEHACRHATDGMLNERESKQLLAAYGIPVTLPELAENVEQAIEIAERLGFPVVLKIQSPEISHKTDVQGVALNLKTPQGVHKAFDEIMQRAHQLRPDAQISGVTVQRMIESQPSLELILGAKKDPVFGAVLAVGAGGTTAEILRDTALELPPLNERLARRMLESLRLWDLLGSYRGRPAMNVDRLIEVLMRLSYLVADFPEIKELDVNPLLVTPEEVVALDARIIVEPDAGNRQWRSYEHLAIRPYPEEYVREVTLDDGRQVLLRPIRPEDEPLWADLHQRVSAETIWQRFRYLFRASTHELASRFCYVDYDRELAIVAEAGTGDQRQFVGVVRLVADPDHNAAEYAVLIADDWQGKGLGRLMTAYSLEIARRWGVQQVYGETTRDNHRMLATFRSAGFQFKRSDDPGIALAELTL